MIDSSKYLPCHSSCLDTVSWHYYVVGRPWTSLTLGCHLFGLGWVPHLFKWATFLMVLTVTGTRSIRGLGLSTWLMFLKLDPPVHSSYHPFYGQGLWDPGVAFTWWCHSFALGRVANLLRLYFRSYSPFSSQGLLSIPTLALLCLLLPGCVSCIWISFCIHS